MKREDNAWTPACRVTVDPKDPSEVERVAIDYMRNRMRLCDSKLYYLPPEKCFEMVTSDKSNTIYLWAENSTEDASLVRSKNKGRKI